MMSTSSSDQAQLPAATPDIRISAPMLVNSSELWFSVYGFGWGYAAFALPAQAVCTRLGAADASAKQLTLAFELGKRRVRQAVQQLDRPMTGERIALSEAQLD
jgi:hypothetical protein